MLQSSPIKEQIYTQLWDAITRRQLLPGAKLEENVISSAFNTSRTTIREVLFVLRSEGLVWLPADRGAFIAQPTIPEAVDRSRIACLFAADAAASMAAAPANARKHIAHEIERLINSIRSGDSDGATAQFLDLIVCMAGLTNRSTVTKQVSIAMAAAQLAMLANRCDGPLLAVAEDLLQALAEEDAAKAKAAIRSYYRAVIADLEQTTPSRRDLKAILARASLTPLAPPSTPTLSHGEQS
ncbi:GntR family transcriptional regulator [Neorhizobium sp. T786]|uniref:GntR family transcriptional regulator n=1 Tax=Pseudorhizobium xiangyangii TaxID=2883104 RepID=UPI001CFFE851|nr:GntR family transcriptional regulator [Neorhizobium xiangyangii]MCB5205555.1 GntR family transcriptional regulator [Neorhizobium xiangyangii]